MTPADKRYLESLVEGAKETLDLYSNKNKTNREKMLVRAFLRGLGVKFSESELVQGLREPVDVTFGPVCFQIKQMLGNRKPGAIAKERLSRFRAAKSISDVMDPWKSSKPLSFAELSREMAKYLARYASKYGPETAKLDALIHFALSDRHLYPPSFELDAATVDELHRQGWRSVSMLSVPYSSVLVAKSDCPRILRNRVGQILMKWKKPWGWFDP